MSITSVVSSAMPSWAAPRSTRRAQIKRAICIELWRLSKLECASRAAALKTSSTSSGVGPTTPVMPSTLFASSTSARLRLDFGRFSVSTVLDSLSVYALPFKSCGGNKKPTSSICCRSLRPRRWQAAGSSHVTVTAKKSPTLGQCHRNHARPGNSSHLQEPGSTGSANHLHGALEPSRTSPNPPVQPAVRHNTCPGLRSSASGLSESPTVSCSSKLGAKLNARVLCWPPKFEAAENFWILTVVKSDGLNKRKSRHNNAGNWVGMP
mmetsp:Transcript_33264/g.89033  ORF Transcript_33264/g.89033 Transcript_33264/m.89033 type:complete len:265 (-) Transcript_33264:363-1157(-)